MAKRKKTPEGAVMDAVKDYLAAQKIEFFRMNTGAVKVGNRMVRFGTPGMADLLLFIKREDNPHEPWPLWIELKAKAGKVSADQEAFEERVKRDGHGYHVARSVEEMVEILQTYGL